MAPLRLLVTDLTEEEIAMICQPLKQGLARTRFLRSLGLHVDRKPDGLPLVNRAHFPGGKRQEVPVDGEGPIWGVH